MATIIDGGADVFDALAGGFPDQETRSWLAEQSQAAQSLLTRTGQEFAQRWRETYQAVTESQAFQMLRNVRHKLESMWNDSPVSVLKTLEAIQTANREMQRWVMANPTVRQRYLDGTVEGYSETYMNYYGAVCGDNHYDYRRVMNGVGQVSEDGTYLVKRYNDLLVEGDKEPTVYQKLDILDTWAVTNYFLDQEGEDPVSPYGNPL